MHDHSSNVPLIEAIGRMEFAAHVDELRGRASQGDDVASIALGYIYFRGGDGVRKDYGEALFWFKKARLEYDVTGFAARHLAAIYYKGLGIAKNHRIAAKYLRSATLRGHSRSRVLFAILQKKGDGALKKPRAAEVLLRVSVCDSKLSLMMRFLALVWLCP